MQEPRLVSLGAIAEPVAQHREKMDPERLGALADSIAAEGLHQPIGLVELPESGRYEIIYGHRRFLAVRSLGRALIEARVYPKGTNVLLVRASENFNRENLNPVEEAHVVRQYLDAGVARAEIARQLRRSLTWVDQRAALLTLPADVLDCIREFGLALSVARQLADVDHEAYRRQLLYEAVQHGATESTAALWRQHYLSDRDRIVGNALKIEQIIADRQKFTLTYPCDWCDAGVAYQDTRTVRLCLECEAQLQASKAAASA